MDNRAVFMEYAQSNSWIAVHLIIGGLVALYYSITAKPSAGAGLAAFGLSATEAARWTEIGVNSLSFLPLGLSLLLYGLSLALGALYPRWAGWVVLVAGAALIYHGAVVAYEGFVTSIFGLAGLIIMTVWAFIMAVLMQRNISRQAIAGPEELLPS